MKIGIDARMHGAKATTGIGVYVKNLIDNILSIDSKNQYVLFMSEDGFSEFNDKRVEKVKVNSHWYSWNEQIEMPKVLLKHNLDLVHFPHFNVPIFYPKKFIVTIHDLTPLSFPGPRVQKSIIRKIGYSHVIKSALKKSEKIITVSNFTKKSIIDNFKVDEEKISPIYLGYDKDKFKVLNNNDKLLSIKKKYGITKDFLLYLGVFRDHKNLPGLVKAFDKIKKSHNLQLVLGGVLDNRFPEVQQAIDNSVNKKDVVVTGFIPEEELPLFYNAAKLFVLPSFSEGFGLVAIESMACGTPVAASDNTCLPEVLEQAAAYFNPLDHKSMADIINEVLTDNNLYQNLREKGLEQVKKYKWKDCAEKTLSIYQSV